MYSQAEILSQDRSSPLDFDRAAALLAAAGLPGVSLNPAARTLTIMRAGGLTADLVWRESSCSFHSSTSDVDVLAVMLQIAGILGGRVRGECGETWTSPWEFHIHPDDVPEKAKGRPLRRRPRRFLPSALVTPLGIALVIFLLNCPWFWPSPPTMASGEQGGEVSVVANEYRTPSAELIFAPLGNFDFRFLTSLAHRVNALTGLRVRVATPYPMPAIQPVADSDQLEALQVLSSLHFANLSLRKDYGEGVIVWFTNEDINHSAAGSRFVFSFHDYPNRLSLVSASRLVQGRGIALTTRQTIHNRLLKFALRCAGEHYYALPRSSDPDSVMYSPLNSVNDVDKAGYRLDRTPPR